MKHYEIKAYSAWQKPQTYITNTESEKDELVLVLKQEQYKVEWEEIEEWKKNGRKSRLKGRKSRLSKR